MAEAAMVGHVGHGVAVVHDHVQIGHGGKHGAVEQSLASLPAAEQGALDAGAEYRLGYRVHRMLPDKKQVATLAEAPGERRGEISSKDYNCDGYPDVQHCQETISMLIVSNSVHLPRSEERRVGKECRSLR